MRRLFFSRPDGEPSDEFYHFIGGQQTYFRAAASLVAPYVNSSRRLVSEQSAPINLQVVSLVRHGMRVPEGDTAHVHVPANPAGLDTPVTIASWMRSTSDCARPRRSSLRCVVARSSRARK